jgi:hypothetical protein
MNSQRIKMIVRRRAARQRAREARAAAAQQAKQHAAAITLQLEKEHTP